eukprot:Blabericola_migrator_1__2183@NODE_1601_length_4192_cov_84_630788_g231_i2_p1_GENE_NODE_1601_length_4192_cov_84_630788_g231_i2NODE_1601_length_4192_cov_84_630788_g231_i2_p1_ORF_typecomplete_len392_score36_82Methyltransf_11/PF08241_12/1_8e09Methyltransf_25/PF13649_6/8_2e08Methyltransf_31/PF13847_6/6_7e06LEDGF/PF11467_8/3_2e03LEDGF/PF11467_8/0_011Methyltransf_23/PF13489_6/0_031Ubie_methyltran/PF01209_18/0_032zfC3Hc3H/PF13891_6/0_9zfC3Hc3H/PF13891_6/52NodS/PF05401_11/0_13Methyltransf_4/PF02390_17/0_1
MKNETLSTRGRRAYVKSRNIDLKSAKAYYALHSARRYTSAANARLQGDISLYLNALRNALSQEKALIGIELGCGSGMSMPIAPSTWFIGVDISHPMLQLAAQHYLTRGDYVRCDLRAILPFRSATFETMQSASALQWLAEQKELSVLQTELPRILTSRYTVACQFYTRSKESTQALTMALPPNSLSCQPFFVSRTALSWPTICLQGHPHKNPSQKLFKFCSHSSLCQDQQKLDYCLLSKRPDLPCILQALRRHQSSTLPPEVEAQEIAKHWDFVVHEYRFQRWLEAEPNSTDAAKESVHHPAAHVTEKLKHLFKTCQSRLASIEGPLSRGDCKLHLTKLLDVQSMLSLCHDVIPLDSDPMNTESRSKLGAAITNEDDPKSDKDCNEKECHR